MNRIEQKFIELRKLNKKAFIAYIMAGDPTLKITHDLVLELERSGVDIIELGVPFSDPIADGPTIQKAGQRALAHKTNLSQILDLVSRLRKRSQIPIILMSYFNVLFRFDLKKFVKEAKQNGIDGVIVPDLIPEEAGDLIKLARKNDFATIFLASPTSSRERLKKIIQASGGFIYYVSLTGVTGIRKSLPAQIKEKVRQIRELTSKPVCVGFGVSRAEQVKEISRFSDGVVVGSVIVEVIEKNLYQSDLVKKIGRFVSILLSN
jgi:tryptophan synthase alpha chain